MEAANIFLFEMHSHAATQYLPIRIQSVKRADFPSDDSSNVAHFCYSSKDHFLRRMLRLSPDGGFLLFIALYPDLPLRR